MLPTFRISQLSTRILYWDILLLNTLTCHIISPLRWSLVVTEKVLNAPPPSDLAPLLSRSAGANEMSGSKAQADLLLAADSNPQPALFQGAWFPISLVASRRVVRAMCTLSKTCKEIAVRNR